MRRKYLLNIIIMTLFLLMDRSILLADFNRESIVIPPNEIYQHIITYSENEDFVKIEKAINIIKELIKDLDSKYSTTYYPDIIKDIEQKNAINIIKKIYNITYLDIKELFSSSIDDLKDGRTPKCIIKIKSAYLNYLVLSPSIQEKDFNSDQFIRKLFRDTSQFLEISNPYGNVKPGSININNLTERTNTIEKKIAAVLPE